jgi:hypothetical protein
MQLAPLHRGAFQEKLPHIFESLEETHRSLSSRITRETFKKRVMAVTAAWADWFLFADEYLKGLEATFTRGGRASTAGAYDLLTIVHFKRLIFAVLKPPLYWSTTDTEVTTLIATYAASKQSEIRVNTV